MDRVTGMVVQRPETDACIGWELHGAAEVTSTFDRVDGEALIEQSGAKVQHEMCKVGKKE